MPKLKLKFICPECKGTVLEEINKGNITNSILLDIDSDSYTVSYGAVENSYNAINYGCYNCGHILEDDIRTITDLPQLCRFLEKQNQLNAIPTFFKDNE